MCKNMCTGFIFKGKDTIFAYNLDISEKDFKYELIKNKNLFSVVIQVGKAKYYTHGVNNKSQFAVLPFMNDKNKYENKKYQRIDLIVNDFIKNKINMKDIKSIKETSNVERGSLHALIGDKKISYLMEPGLGKKEIDKHQVISNFPLLKKVDDENKFYGKERYKFIDDNLKKLKDISIEDAIYLLKYSSQEGEYSTKISFIYSCNENCVYYFLNRDFDNVLRHNF